MQVFQLSMGNIRVNSSHLIELAIKIPIRDDEEAAADN